MPKPRVPKFPKPSLKPRITMTAPNMPSLDILLSTLSSPLHNLHCKPSFLRRLLTSVTNPVPPTTRPPPKTREALIATLRFRLLNTDITESLLTHANLCFPHNILDGDARGVGVGAQGPVVTQVRDVVDMTTSRIDALDALEMAGRGEVAKGKVVVRIAPEDGEDGGNGGSTVAPVEKKAMHKLLLEDAVGRRVWAVEETRVEGVKESMGIGCKMVLRGCEVAHGVILLRGDRCEVLGGNLEEANKEWMQGRIKRVEAQIEGLKNNREVEG